MEEHVRCFQKVVNKSRDKVNNETLGIFDQVSDSQVSKCNYLFNMDQSNKTWLDVPTKCHALSGCTSSKMDWIN